MLTNDENFLLKMSCAQPYGIYADKEIGPMDNNWCDFETACQCDDSRTRDADTAFEWICDYLEDEPKLLKRLQSEYELLSIEYKKWDFLVNLKDELDDFPDDIDFYSYAMQRTLVGVCFTLETAKEIVAQYDPSLKPHYETLSRYDCQGFYELKEIAQFLQNKAKEL